MKVVILAGGLGSRISEETSLRPKPMINIGSMPILWHIMKIYSAHGFNEFVICCGFKGYVIKEYFANYFLHMSDVTINLANNQIQIHQKKAEDWKVTLVDTGEDSLTGKRLVMIKDYLNKDEPFCLTYGDGLGNVDITKSIEFHKSHQKLVTMTTVSPPGRFGAIEKKGSEIVSFMEKPRGDGGEINGGFFVVSPKAIEYIGDQNVSWEVEPLAKLIEDKQVKAFHHGDFWQPMDTMRDKIQLEKLWASGSAPWKIW